jgi:hypothetical protein
VSSPALPADYQRMPDYNIFMATEDVARAGGDEVETQWLPHVRPGHHAPYPTPDSDRIPTYDHVSLGQLWGLLTGEGYQDSMVDAFERIYDAGEDGPWVERLPQDIVDRLGALEPEQLRPLAESWAKTEEMQSFNPVMEPEPILAGIVRLFRRDQGELHRKREEARVRDVEEGLSSLVRLVQRARQSGKGVYLWCSL